MLMHLNQRMSGRSGYIPLRRTGPHSFHYAEQAGLFIPTGESLPKADRFVGEVCESNQKRTIIFLLRDIVECSKVNFPYRDWTQKLKKTMRLLSRSGP